MHVKAAIRRAAMGDVKTVAVDSIVVNVNTSDVPTENIAHRAAMVPLRRSVPTSFRVTHDGPCTIELPHAVHEGIPLVVLKHGQTLDMTVYTAIGCGAQHAKWSLVAGVTADLQMTPCGDMTSDEILNEACDLIDTQFGIWKEAL